MKKANRSVDDSRRQVAIERPEKVFFPESHITKGELIGYYEQIAPRMLPYLRGRPLMLERLPDGIGKPGFFQKSAPRHYPDWVETVSLGKKDGTIRQVVCNDARTLVFLANQACITLHTWLSQADRPEVPDACIIDIDPSGENMAPVVAAAVQLKALLAELEVPAYLKATGGRGLHVLVPLVRDSDYDSVRALANEMASVLVENDPEHYTLAVSKKERRGRVYLDVNRNSYAQTAVAPYSVRARPGAPVAFPLEWNELRRADFRSDRVTLRNALDALKDRQDPWRGSANTAVSADVIRRKLKDWKSQWQHTKPSKRGAGGHSA